ncbi:MAG: hypothetical protein PWP08_708 [Methanofollis sp.]|nr:hypothetical protein [Methanofollis sp.]
MDLNFYIFCSVPAGRLEISTARAADSEGLSCALCGVSLPFRPRFTRKGGGSVRVPKNRQSAEKNVRVLVQSIRDTV